MSVPTRFDEQSFRDFARQIEDRLAALETSNIDMSKRRVINAGKPISPFDYVRKFDLDQAKAEVVKQLTAPTPELGVLNSLTKHAIVLGDGGEKLKSGPLGTTTTVLHGNASADPTYSAVVEADITLADNTTDDVTSTKHGFAPKAPADATKFLNGAATPAYAQVKDSDLSLSDIATNNASTSKHGFLLKLDNNAAHFMDGTGAWSSPASGASRGDVAVTTASLADQAVESGTIALGKSSIVYKVVVDHDARVRLYSTSTGRDGDVTRVPTSAPPVNTYLLLDVVLNTSGTHTFYMQPAALAFNMDGTVVTTIYYNITNLSGGSSTITATFTRLLVES